uniref:Syndecan n=1 Tax=Naja naja TaxID=35670 RepID=A0A8C6X4B8_NAJNA
SFLSLENVSIILFFFPTGVIAGGLVGLLFAGFLVAFMLYRMKKKDEGSYSLDEPKQSNGGYQKPHKQEEFYA